MSAKAVLTWAVFSILSIVFLSYFVLFPPVNYGGDIAEYYGITESLKNHFGYNLTFEDRKILETKLQKAYFEDPSYYILGVDNHRYPVHFVAYSTLVTPIRLLIEYLNLNSLIALSLTNLLIFTVVNFLIIKNFLHNHFQKIGFIIIAYLSPLIYFIIWPGPDIFYTALLLLSIFLFFKAKFFLSALVVALASWHSQPLAIISLAAIVYYFITHTNLLLNHEHQIIIRSRILLGSAFLILITLVPYFYNYLIFGMLTPWTEFKDGWTQINSFGLQNISLKKLFEQFFDLNIGLFWYFPIAFLVGIFYLIKSIISDKRFLFIPILILITAFFYQTNPAWNYGTAGFGPSRHIIFVIPFLIYLFIKHLKHSFISLLVIILFILAQSYILYFNGLLSPNLLNSLEHSPIAKFVIENYPNLYNPTPEIFSDRTNHRDSKFPESAIYKVNGVCKKAYVLVTDIDRLRMECGYIPTEYEKKIDNPFLRKANYQREVKSIEATFWPDPYSCGDNYQPTKEQGYICIKTIDDFMEQTGINDINRIKQVDNLDGVWRLEKGDPLTFIVPSGYFIHHYSFEGIYVNY